MLQMAIGPIVHKLTVPIYFRMSSAEKDAYGDDSNGFLPFGHAGGSSNGSKNGGSIMSNGYEGNGGSDAHFDSAPGPSKEETRSMIKQLSGFSDRLERVLLALLRDQDALAAEVAKERVERERDVKELKSDLEREAEVFYNQEMN